MWEQQWWSVFLQISCIILIESYQNSEGMVVEDFNMEEAPRLTVSKKEMSFYLFLLSTWITDYLKYVIRRLTTFLLIMIFMSCHWFGILNISKLLDILSYQA